MSIIKLNSIVMLSLLIANTGCGKEVDDTSQTVYTNDTGDQKPLIVDGLEEELINFGGCGDIFMYSSSSDDKIGIFINAAGIVEEAFAEDVESTSFNMEIGSNDGQARVILQTGERITTEACNDAIVPGNEPVVFTELTAVSGSVTFIITPTDEPTDWGEFPALGEVQLNTVEFTTIEGDSIVIDNWGFSAAVGWLPG